MLKCFEFEIIEILNEKNQLNEKETFHIKKYKSLVNENGYNFMSGGNLPPITNKRVFVYLLFEKKLVSVFKSVKECSKFFKVSVATINKLIQGEKLEKLESLNKYKFIKNKQLKNYNKSINTNKKKLYSNIKLFDKDNVLKFNTVLEMSKYFDLSYRHTLRLIKNKKYKQYKIKYNYE